MTSDEKWLPVVGYPDYEVSDHGRVRSLDRIGRSRWGTDRLFAGKILTPVWVGGTKARRYPACTLYSDGVAKQRTVHILVLEAFVCPRPHPKLQGLHADDDPKNNFLSNLSWGTPTKNAEDKKVNGNCWKTNITECPQGHQYDEENTYYAPTTNHRLCRKCIKAKNKGNANIDRTECPQGHAYDEANTYRDKTGRRHCRTCSRDKAREYQRKKAAAKRK